MLDLFIGESDLRCQASSPKEACQLCVFVQLIQLWLKMEQK